MNPRLRPVDALSYYVRFHERLQPYIDQCLIASFDSVTERYDKVLTRLNNRFCTEFDIFEPTPENFEACFEQLNQVAAVLYSADKYHSHVSRPHPDRVELKKKLIYRIENDSSNLIDSARSIYAEYATQSTNNDS